MNLHNSHVRRKVEDGGMFSEATYSDCENYRYELTRVWNADTSRIMFVMLNPSTATEMKNDPTVARCETRARSLGFGAFRVCNIFALRSTNPGELYQSEFPIGEENNKAIKRGSYWADKVVCAWGNHGKLLNRGQEAELLLRKTGNQLFHLGMTKKYFPRHPLYLPHAQPLIPWL